MDFDRLRAFVFIVEEGGISPAARRLHRTQPAVTRMLQTLEDQVGVQLVDRRARPMRPTATGARVLEYAREILRTADRLTEKNLRDERQTLRMAVSRSLLWRLHCEQFAAPAPPLNQTDFVVRSGWSPRLYRGFARGEYDCAVLLMPSDWTPDIPCRIDTIGREPLVVVAPRGAATPPKARARIEDLVERPWILNPDGCGFRQALTRTFAGLGYRLHVQFEVDAAPHEHIAMVAAGVGCSIVPASALRHPTGVGRRVQVITIPKKTFELAITIIWNDRYHPLPGTNEALAAVFAPLEPKPVLKLV